MPSVSSTAAASTLQPIAEEDDDEPDLSEGALEDKAEREEAERQEQEREQKRQELSKQFCDFYQRFEGYFNPEAPIDSAQDRPEITDIS